MTRAAALVSGGGAQLQALIDCVFFGEIPDFELSVIASDPEAYAISRAKSAGVPFFVVDRELFPNGASFSLALLNKLRDMDIGLVILTDFHYPLGEGISHLYRGRAIGVRPALVPAFDGVKDDAVCAAAVGRGVKLTGATAYYADEAGGVGPIIMQRTVEVRPGDNADLLRRRVMEEAEWKLLPEAVKLHCAGKLHIQDGRVLIDGQAGR